MIAIHRNSLSRLSDSQVIRRLDALVQKEREATLEILAYLIEMDRRSLYLERGYTSLYEFCIRELHYSEAAAMRRIIAARLMREYPEILGMLEKNELNLTIVCMLSGILNEKNKKYILKKSRYKSKRQLEAIVARHKPGKDIKDRVRTIFLKIDAATIANSRACHTNDSGNMDLQRTCSNPDNSKQRDWGKFTTAGGGKKPSADSTLEACTVGNIPAKACVLQKKYKLEFTVEPECMNKIEEVKAILSRKYPNGVPLGKLIEEMADEYLEKHSPERKRKRREKRKAIRKEKKNGRRPQAEKIKEDTTKNKRTNATGASRSRNRGPTRFENEEYNNNRHIPQAVRDEVFARDAGRCTYMGPEGARCNSNWNLEIDHIKPNGKGGGHSIDNLRLLCAKHNNLEAHRAYGKEFMKRKMHKAKPMRE